MSMSPDAAGPSRPSLRCRPGASAHATEPPPVIKLEDLDSAFQLSEYLDVLVQRGDRVRDLVRLPLEGGGSGDDGDAWEVDENLWLYVHLLRLPRDLTPLIVSLLDVCTAETCPSMIASHWHYMCATHPGPPRQCSSIDYILHTLDQTSQVLTSSKLFPSRVSISPSSRRQLEAVTRRVARFFGHAYHHHPEVFEACEGETELCSRLINLVADFGLVAMDDIPLPTDLFLLRPVGGSSSSGSDDGDDASADSEDTTWGVGLRADYDDDDDDSDDDDFVPRRASNGRAPSGILLDFGVDDPCRNGAGDGGDDDEDDDDDHAGSDDEVKGSSGTHDDETPDGSSTPYDGPVPAGAPSSRDTVDVDSDVPTLEAGADPSPTSSSDSSPRLAHGSPPTPSDSPEPPSFGDDDAEHHTASKQAAAPVAATMTTSAVDAPVDALA